MAKHRFSRFVELSVTYPWECSDQDDTTIREWPLIDDIISWAFQQHVGKKLRHEKRNKRSHMESVRHSQLPYQLVLPNNLPK